MKYKNINSAIHNFGHSFFSLMNYIDDKYIIDELIDIHKQGYDIEIDWFSQSFKPNEFLSERIKQSISYWANSLNRHFNSHNIDIKYIKTLYFKWPKNQKKYMFAIDDRDKEYKRYITEII